MTRQRLKSIKEKKLKLAARLCGLIFFINTFSTPMFAEEDDRSIPTIDWKTKIDKFQFDKEKFVGQRLTVKCPPAPKNRSLSGVYGTDFYPSESPICVAALHAGIITTEGGIVTLQLNPGQSEYKGSEQNGVKTSDLPETKRSISFVNEETAIDTDEIPWIDWNTKFTRSGLAYRHLIGQRMMFRCPPMPKGQKMSLVYGTDSYDFSSLVCQAALHAGKLTKEGGMVTVQIDGKVEKLTGSIRNGVETKSKSSGDRTISFVTVSKE